MNATVVATEFYAATYAEFVGKPGVDVIDQPVERDEDGVEQAREEGGWTWIESTDLDAPNWTLEDAEELLWNSGYRLASGWTRESDLGGVAGWTAQLEKV